MEELNVSIEFVGSFKIVLDNDFEGWVTTPHWFHLEWFGPFIGRTIVEVDEKWAVVRFCPRKVCYNGVGEELYPRVIGSTPVKCFKNKISPIPIPLVSPGKLTTLVP